MVKINTLFVTLFYILLEKLAQYVSLKKSLYINIIVTNIQCVDSNIYLVHSKLLKKIYIKMFSANLRMDKNICMHFQTK